MRPLWVMRIFRLRGVLVVLVFVSAHVSADSRRLIGSMSETTSRWTYPGGIKITDWTALVALVLSLCTALWSYIATQLPPRIDVATPETIQLMCSDYDHQQMRCHQDAFFSVVADLFSVWNVSPRSTKAEVLLEISGQAQFMKNDSIRYSVLLEWKYFTDMTDDSSPERNTARVKLEKDDLANLETEFIIDPRDVEDSDMLRWSYFVEAVRDESEGNGLSSITFLFEIDFLYSADRFIECVYIVDDRMKENLEKDPYYYENFPRSVSCELIKRR